MAFTLAEVLITLGIIGVVAAVTMPALITNYQKSQTVKSLKQAYNFLYQATEMAKLEHGDLDTWGFENISAVDFKNKYLFPFFKNAKNFNKTPYLTNPKWSNGLNEGSIMNINNCFQLPQGYLYCFQKDWSTYVTIFIDINGVKGPNLVRKDIFLATFGTASVDRPLDSGLQMYGLARGNSYQHCNKISGNGSACGLKILRDGWQIKDDYPW